MVWLYTAFTTLSEVRGNQSCQTCLDGDINTSFMLDGVRGASGPGVMAFIDTEELVFWVTF